MKHLFFLLLVAAVFGASCNNQDKKDEELILEYIEENGLTAMSTDEGVYYVIEVEGTGDNPIITDDVTVDYEGFLLNGTKFDSSIDRGAPATFPLTGVILGWQIGIPYFKEGGSGKLLIPSKLGYGSNPPPGSIPRNAVLVFDVDLIEIN